MRWPTDWSLKICLSGAAAITVIHLVLVCLSAFDINIPVVTQISGFIFVTLIPGLLIARIFRLHNLGLLESITCTVGLSLAAVMFYSAFLNFILPPIGINQPITPLPLAISFSILYFILTALAWLSDRHFSSTPPSTKYTVEPKSILLLLLMLCVVILGVLVLEKTGSNIILMLGLGLVLLIFVLATSGRIFTENVYPPAVYAISLALLYQTTLMSPYLTGTDIYFEYQFYRQVAQSGLWNYALPGTINSCLSIVMAVPVYAGMLNIDGVWVLKAVYPLLFSLVPLIMYRIFQGQIGSLPSFLAVFFFISVPTFSLEMIGLGRQQFAEIFFVLIILLLTQNSIDRYVKITLITIFALGITVSHYTFGFINIVYSGALIALVAVLRSHLFTGFWQRLTARTGGLPVILARPSNTDIPIRALTASFIVVFVLSLAWYGLIASGSNLQFFAGTLTILMQKIGINIQELASRYGGSQYIFGGQGDLLVSAALGLDFSQASVQGKIFRIIQYITQLLIVAGYLRLIIKPSGLAFKREYIAYSLVSCGILAGCIFLPWFSNILNITRWYHIALITLSPFLVVGARSIWELTSWITTGLKNNPSEINAPREKRYLTVMAWLLLLPYFAFNCGLVFELSGQRDTSIIDTPYSIALSSYRLDLTGIFNHKDGAAARWLSTRACDNSTAYTDVHASKILLYHDTLSRLKIKNFTPSENISTVGYIFLSSWNVNKGELTFTSAGRPGMREHLNINAIPDIINGNIIYSSGGSEIYLNSADTDDKGRHVGLQ